MKKLIALTLALMLTLMPLLISCNTVSDGGENDGMPDGLSVSTEHTSLPSDESDGSEDDQLKDVITTDESTTDESTTDESTTDESTTDESTTNESTTDEPTTDEPTTDESTTDESITDESTTDESTTDEPTTDESTTDESTTDESTTDESTTDESTTDESIMDESTTDESTTDEPTDEPDDPIGHIHNYITVVTAPTCTDGGYTTYSCSTCSDSYVSNRTSATGHTEKTVAGREATCTQTGLTDGVVCTACGTTIIQQTVIRLADHKYESVVTAPTCTDGGYTTYSCSACSDSYVSNRTSATGHTWKAATIEAPKTCGVCGATEGDKLPEAPTEELTEAPTEAPTTQPSAPSGYDKTLYVNYIDVGQGDSIFIKVGDCDILIDAGKSNQGATVSSYLKSKSVDDIELMVNSHPDNDHYGGLAQVLNDFVVEEVWISAFAKSTSTYTSFKSAVTKEGLTAKTPAVGTVFRYEYLTLTVLYSSAASNSNDSSLILMLQYGSFKFLFTGDISTSVEGKLISSGADLSCDVLKVAHHGSAGSSGTAFLKATGADYGVISVGAGNSYGHPTSEALARLSSAGISVYRTDQDGDVVFSTDGASMTLPSGSTVGGDSGSSGGTDSGSSGGTGSGSSGGSSSDSTTGAYVANSSTGVYHLLSCSRAPTTNKIYINDTIGYTPCYYCIGSGGSTTTYIANSSTKVYHLASCSYAPTTNKITITNTSGYTPCSHCIGSSSTKTYIANTESKVYHLSTCSYLPAASKQKVITSTSGYTPCGHCIG